jgi:hypothetical protein
MLPGRMKSLFPAPEADQVWLSHAARRRESTRELISAYHSIYQTPTPCTPAPGIVTIRQQHLYGIQAHNPKAPNARPTQTHPANKKPRFELIGSSTGFTVLPSEQEFDLLRVRLQVTYIHAPGFMLF